MVADQAVIAPAPTNQCSPACAHADGPGIFFFGILCRQLIDPVAAEFRGKMSGNERVVRLIGRQANNLVKGGMIQPNLRFL